MVIWHFVANMRTPQHIWSMFNSFHVLITWQMQYIDEIYRSAHRSTGSCRSCSVMPGCVLSRFFLLSWMHFLCPRQVLRSRRQSVSRYTAHHKGVHVSAEREEKVCRDNTGAAQSERCCSNFSPRTKRRVLDFPVTLTPIVEVRKPTRPADMIRRCSQPWKQ